MNFLYTVTKLFKSDYRIKESKFLGYLHPAESKTEADHFLETVKDEHPTATHHCYAWRVNPNKIEEFDQDDGEPSGTAGLPILNALKSADLVNCIMVSVRYYGGTKLGKSGLIDAYGESARQCIEHAVMKEVVPVQTYRIQYNYEHQGIIDKLKNDFTLIELNSVYLEDVTYEFGCPVDEIDRLEGKLKSVTHLFEDFEKTGESFHIKK
ncbi:hypothetical protein CWD77_01835 [Rhodohalobacter barkolensis]|uniref:Impact N-terminal domain-containing protein n=1 Tax=Rhodohalobacter barkolensis TaxID=2053187 RepID=A0A2N0VJ62_9BACT|nr:hypothetical protein CWD77_01835 [Rhodohalobacter barkolensis]